MNPNSGSDSRWRGKRTAFFVFICNKYFWLAKKDKVQRMFFTKMLGTVEEEKEGGVVVRYKGGVSKQKRFKGKDAFAMAQEFRRQLTIRNKGLDDTNECICKNGIIEMAANSDLTFDGDKKPFTVFLDEGDKDIVLEHCWRVRVTKAGNPSYVFTSGKEKKRIKLVEIMTGSELSTHKDGNVLNFCVDNLKPFEEKEDEKEEEEEEEGKEVKKRKIKGKGGKV